MKRKFRFLLIIIFLFLAIIIVFVDIFQSPNKENLNTEINQTPTNTTSHIDDYLSKFNQLSSHTIENLSYFDLHDRLSSHYRTEFRLYAFKDALAETGTLDNNIIDIIDYSSFSLSNSCNLRIYTSISNIDIKKEFIKISCQIFDSTITENDLQKIYNNINDYRFTLGKNNYIQGYVQGNEIMLDYKN